MATRTRTPSTDPLRAVAYLRVSTDEQRNGPEVQRADIVAWAARAGVEVVAWHTDNGVSGAAPVDRRPALLAALADLRGHRAGQLVVSRRDRLARDVMNAAMIERMATDAGARIASAAGEGGDGTDPAAVLMRTMVDAFAQYERAMIAARTKAALAVKRARGEAVSHAPYGYRAVDGRLEPDAAEQVVIAQVRALRDAGMSFRGIVAELARAGVLGRTGASLGVAQVHALAVVAA